MSKAAIVSFIIDLKLTPQGEVKILEFGDLYRSGFKGYERLAGVSPLTETVFPFYEQFGVPVYQAGSLPEGYRYKNDLPRQMDIVPVTVDGGPLDPESLNSHSAIIMSEGFSNESQRRAMKKPPFDRLITTNSNGLINACFEDKNILAAFAQKYAPELFPRQKLYPVNRGLLDIAQVLKDFAEDETVVLKTPWDALAKGVDLIDTKKLSLAFNMAAGNSYLKLFKKPRLLGMPAAVVQEYTTGKPVEAKNAKDESGLYDPTMRVFVTAWHDGGQTHIKCHSAYYKMPPKPLSENKNRANRISKVGGNSGPKSAPVPQEDLEATFFQLEERLPALFHPLLTTSSYDYAREFLQSDDDALARVGFLLAADHCYFDRPDNQEDGYPEELASLIYENKERLPMMRGMFLNDRAPYAPSGLQASLKEKAAEEGYQPRGFSYLAAALGLGSGAVGAAALATFLIFGGDGSNDPAAQIFADNGHGASVQGLENLKSFAFNSVKATPALRKAIDDNARAAGYEICHTGQWGDEAQRLLPAFKQAMADRTANVIKIDFDQVDRIENNGVIVHEEVYTDTVIYSTNCTPKP